MRTTKQIERIRRFHRPRRARHVRPALDHLEIRTMLSSSNLVMPANTVSSESAVLYTSAAVPLKEITLVNNTSQTVYPILTDENSQAAPGGTESLYDPFDPLNQEYRGYVGYTQSGQDYLGLAAGQEITIGVPLVFWNAGRVQIATDGTNLIPSSITAPNPFNYFATNPDGTSTARFAAPAMGPAGTDGIVMWYHAEVAEQPAPDAPSQLTEMTLRDPYLATLPTAQYIASSQEQELINYDLSYVDSMILPVAMEAATVSGANATPTGAVGWTGASLTNAQLQTAIQNFTSNNPAVNCLGQYFAGNGYPTFNLPEETVSGLMVPSGMNTIALGPDYNVRSSYNNNEYMLSTGGTSPIQYFSGGTTNATTVLKVQSSSVLAELAPGLLVTSSGTDIAPDTTIASVDAALGEVILSGPALASATTNVYTFTRPVTDYATSAMENLWYSWADYYVLNNQVPNVSNLAASIQNTSQVLTFSTPVTAKLVPGMEVSGPGIPAGTIVLSVANGGTSVDLSTFATSTESNAQYTFDTPQLIPRSSEVKSYALSFSTQDQATAEQFAQTVYTVMSTLSNIPVVPNVATLSSQLLFNAIGGNVGLVPGISSGGGAIETELTNDIISILRGVSNYQTVPQSTGLWYPSPATPTAGADINGSPASFGVYDMDPFVWFVHQDLGLTGYGFSNDDSVGDVNANGTNQLEISIGGLTGLSNQTPYSAGATTPPVSTPPTVTTGAISGVTSTSATLNGTVDPDGAATTYWFVYGTNSSLATGTSTTVVQSAGSGTSAEAETAALSGLLPATTYYYELEASNAYGTTKGAIASFTTAAKAPAPAVTTSSASGVTSTSATLNGTVDPEGSATTYSFVYGTNSTLSSGTTSTALESAGSGTSAVSETVVLSGLQPATTYYFQLDATNASGTSKSSIVSLTTAAPAAPTSTPLMPANTVASESAVFYNSSSVPLKEITLTNNSSQTVYPILEDENGQPAPGGVSLYDPFDPLNQEFRGYVGYTLNGQNYLGLPAGQQITIAVPLVFWNAGRIQIATDGSNLIPTSTTAPNPFNYYATNPDGTSTAIYAAPALGPVGTDALVMWYHAEVPEGIALDAPTQLTEMTIRDPYLATLPTAAYIDPSQEEELINYDVSYVDSIILPVAMEAAMVTGANGTPTDAAGWTGASMSFAQMQTAIANFTSDNPSLNGLGQYFGGNGYPSFNIPDESVSGIKIPSGGNVIGLGPYYGVRSSYNSNEDMLSTGGTSPIQYFSSGTTNGTTVMTVQNSSVLAELTPGLLVTSSGTDLAPGTTIVQVDASLGEVILSEPATASASNNVYTFTKPTTDYATNAMENLWWSWANYYVANNQVPDVSNIAASVAANSQVLTFSTPVTATLVPGMQVSGPGIPAGTFVISVASGGTSVDLSTFATSNESDALYTFDAPRLIPASSEVKPYTLSFSSQDQATANLFAQAVYTVMESMSTIPVVPNVGTPSTQLLYNVIGDNVGQIPGISSGGGAIESAITFDVTSILRGVDNYSTVPVSTGLWYPDPATPTAGADINGAAADFGVYNLDPFVWFVHEELGLTGYGFSVDDSIGDVGINGANQLQMSIGGLNGLSNQSAYSSTGTAGANAIVATTSGTQVSSSAATTAATVDDATVSPQNSVSVPGTVRIGAGGSLSVVRVSSSGSRESPSQSSIQTDLTVQNSDLSKDEVIELLALELTGQGTSTGRGAGGRRV
jgi:hypothetical protein